MIIIIDDHDDDGDDHAMMDDDDDDDDDDGRPTCLHYERNGRNIVSLLSVICDFPQGRPYPIFSIGSKAPPNPDTPATSAVSQRHFSLRSHALLAFI